MKQNTAALDGSAVLQILPLPAEKYAGVEFSVTYKTEKYYDVLLLEDGFRLVEKIASPPLEKQFSDTLFGEWLEAPEVFGAFCGGELLGFVEGSRESWHSLYRISNVYVYPQHRKKGVGRALLQHIIDHARQQGEYRGVILETQTCNYAAISLYKKLGFFLTRIELNEYTNTDVENKEVRIDLLMRFD